MTAASELMGLPQVSTINELARIHGTTRRPGVLVALADARGCAELAAFLTQQGFTVWLAGCGVEAIATYLEHTSSIDLLFLDADLPDLPGPAFLRRFAKHFPGVPCIFRSGATEMVAERLRAAGAAVVPASFDSVAIAERLWETVAFEFLVEA